MPKPTCASLGVVVAVALATSIVILTGAAAPAAANHGDLGNLTITLPEASDHQPGDRNPEGATVRYFFQGTDAFAEAGAPNGATLDAIVVESEGVDFSACGVGNIAAFGLDRGGNNSGTQSDKDLVQHMKTNDFRESGLYLRFYQESDFGGDPVFVNPEDAIRAQQGAGSSDGPCYTMPEAPGWYQMTGYLNGTNPEGEYVEEDTTSHYFYVCDCESEADAREQLGPPPSAEGASTQTSTPIPETPTATATATAATTDAPSTPTAARTETAVPTATLAAQPTATATPATTDTESGGQPSDGDGGLRETPTPGSGAGFGLGVTALALAAIALLAGRS
ncbi:hypothetical protein HWV23_11110 [Natronomonas halophila]|uniref:hypothetical protein n=1 Tax=Natronomonas halophila TaxID=2747817 RepID=UPI0015B780B2|nr:hypothetical protein [Natronomonas halophila]QLD86246.1 hypothetical protein HWV23_11110 [Natronomonas halophila]